MNIFTVLHYTQENGGRNEYEVLGTFKNETNAVEVLKEQYAKDYEVALGIENDEDVIKELSYLDDVSYHIEVDCFWDCGCWIEISELKD